jgi:TRAP-type C4-dicarboxylate transport system permease small subunit
MSTRKVVTVNRTALYLIALVIIIGAFLLLGGGSWMTGMMHRGSSMGTIHLNWVQILISLALGFMLGLVASKQRWL